jgi:hypothetical protein
MPDVHHLSASIIETDPPTHGCMTCKGQQPYTVEDFPTGNTGWRCRTCGHILHLIPGLCVLRQEG